MCFRGWGGGGVCDSSGIKEHFLEEVTSELKIRVRTRRQMLGVTGEGGRF